MNRNAVLNSNHAQFRARGVSKTLTFTIKIWLLVIALPFFTQTSLATQSCKTAVDSTSIGASFLISKNPNFHSSPVVEKVKKQVYRDSGANLQKPTDKISAWIKYLESLHASLQNKPHLIGQIKKIYHNQNVIKPSEVPQGYYDLQAKIARERGYGDIQISETQKLELAKNIVVDQQKSLDQWIEYFVSADTDMYPIWLKYWALAGLVKLSKFDLDTFTFGNRTRETVAPFVELNREALALVIDSVLKKLNKTNLDSIKDQTLLSLLDGMNFGKLYAHALRKSGVGNKGKFTSNEGKWIVYKKGTSHLPLFNSLQGQNTGWCTAGASTAKSQLAKGDFHVFYSKNAEGKYSVPRVAVRMENSSIAEVRGVGENQNLDPQISATNIVEQKMKEFGSEGKKYKKKDQAMKLLTEIEQKQNLGLMLTQSDLVFLYELEEKIVGFGYQKDPRIEEIKKKRDLKNDLVLAFGGKYSRADLSTTKDEALDGKSKFHYGDLDLSDLLSAQGITLPGSVSGDLLLNSLVSAEGLIFPKSVGRNLWLNSLTSVQGLILPNSIDGDLLLNSLSSAQGLTLPKSIGGNLDLRWLSLAEGLIFPKSVGGNLFLNGLASVQKLILPDSVGGNLFLDGLISAEVLTLPMFIGGHANVSRLTSAQMLNLPKSVGRSLKIGRAHV